MSALRSTLRTILRFLCHPLCRHTETLTKTAGTRVYTECLCCEYQSKGVEIAGHDYASTKHSWEPAPSAAMHMNKVSAGIYTSTAQPPAAISPEHAQPDAVCYWCNTNATEAAIRHEGPHSTWCPHFREEQRGGHTEPAKPCPTCNKSSFCGCPIKITQETARPLDDIEKEMGLAPVVIAPEPFAAVSWGDQHKEFTIAPVGNLAGHAKRPHGKYGIGVCSTCGQPKEVTRPNSKKCRACDRKRKPRITNDYPRKKQRKPWNTPRKISVKSVRKTSRKPSSKRSKTA